MPARACAIALILAAAMAQATAKAATPPARDAAGGVTLAFTGNAGSAATLSLGPRGDAMPRLRVQTRRAGVPGSVIALFVDRAASPLLVTTLPADACGVATGESLCVLDITPTVAEARAIVTAFERGAQARLSISTGGVMAMDGTASLIGFRRAWR